MKTHFCKVGKTSPNINTTTNLKDLEDRYTRSIEEAYNIEQTDMGLSDILLYEAQKLKQRILNLKRLNSKGFDAAF
ncbi:Lacal_2735 family protein [Psychroserpens sp. SPM9]|uniref:Lacal_2735 family protein n=1 Tax=Psychroserpens sp. SPM9 TaxID=2975598 RepID=UPI0021A7157D|nr:Lacal_2735 family protein [Psychroserpens sp. SPM9]MDG5492576.1 Lacal_2735 family protein [Psychroserpens sp. SPM9]